MHNPTHFILFLQPILHFLFILFHLIKFAIQWLNKASLSEVSNHTAYLPWPSSAGGQKNILVEFLINIIHVLHSLLHIFIFYILAVCFKLHYKEVERTLIFFPVALDKAADENQTVRKLWGLTSARKNLFHVMLPLGSVATGYDL